MGHSILAVLPAALLLASASARPQMFPFVNPPPQKQNCEVYNILQDGGAILSSHDGEAKLFGLECTSTEVSRCGLSEGSSYSHTTTFSISEGLAVKFKLTSILEVQPSVSITHGWAKTNTKVQAVNAECPMGGVRCGMSIKPTFCTVTGKTRPQWAFGDLAKGCPWPPKGIDSADYKSTSICRRGTSESEQMNSVVHMEICVLKCNRADNCNLSVANKLKRCPGVTQQHPFCEYSDEIGQGKGIPKGVIGCKDPIGPEHIFFYWGASGGDNAKLTEGVSFAEFEIIWKGGDAGARKYKVLQERNAALAKISYDDLRKRWKKDSEELAKHSKVNEGSATGGKGNGEPLDFPPTALNVKYTG